MSVALTDQIHIHVHLPEQDQVAGVSSRDEHVHLYLHMGGRDAFGAATSVEAPSGRPWLKIVVVAALVAVPAMMIGAMSSHHGAVSGAPASIVSLRTGDASPTEPAQPLPPALAQELAQPPNIAPPAGQPVSGPEGPAAFGLN
jgi:hypothetical protein